MKKEQRLNHLERLENFYTKCGEILEIDHDYHDPYPYKTRWNNRVLGNGRYPGFGVIKYFSSDCIQVMPRNSSSKEFNNIDDVYNYLMKIK